MKKYKLLLLEIILNCLRTEQSLMKAFLEKLSVLEIISNYLGIKQSLIKAKQKALLSVFCIKIKF